MQLAGKRVVVTGGARGIGASAVKAFAGEGASVVSLDLTDGSGAQVAAQASEHGPGKAHYLHCDISSRPETHDVMGQAVGHLGGLDALVHVAGIERRSPAESIPTEEWDAIMNVNLRGTFITNQEAFPYLRDNGGGRIVNFASGAGLYPYLQGAAYSASKAGVIAWTRTIAHEWGRYKITVVAVNPAMWTPMYEETRSHFSPEQLAAHDAVMATRIPLGGKLGDPDTDIAPVLVFLVSDASHFITAQVLPVDGGMVPVR